MNEGKLYELQEDGKYSVYQVQYNPQKDYKEGKKLDDQIPTVMKLVGGGHDMNKLSDEK
jgi:hypothetical protein